MSINQTGRYGWELIRCVTAADDAIDGSTSGYRLWDLTQRNVWELPPEANKMEIIFCGTGAADDAFRGRLWTKCRNGPARRIATFCGHLGTCYGCNTNAVIDGTGRLTVDQIVLDATNDFHSGDITVKDISNNRAAAFVVKDLAGAQFIYLESTTIGTGMGSLYAWGRYW